MLNRLKQSHLWKQEADIRYAAITGYIRALEALLLKESDYESLLASDNISSYLSLLEQRAYPSGNKLGSVIGFERMRLNAFLSRYSPDVYISEMLILYQDYQTIGNLLKLALSSDGAKLNRDVLPANIENLLFPIKLTDVYVEPGVSYSMGAQSVESYANKDDFILHLWRLILDCMGKFKDKDFYSGSLHYDLDRMMADIPNIDLGQLKYSELEKCFVSLSFLAELNEIEKATYFGFQISDITGLTRLSDMPKFFKIAIKEAIYSYSQNKDIGAVARIVNKVYFLHLHALAHESRQVILLEYAVVKSQLAIENALVRSYHLGVNERGLLENWVPGSSYSKEEFLNLYRSGKSPDFSSSKQAGKIVNPRALDKSEYQNSSSIQAKGIKYFSISSYQDEVWHAFMRRSVNSLYGPSVLIGYYWAKQVELQNVRLVWQLKQEGFNRDEIRKFIRKGLLDA